MKNNIIALRGPKALAVPKEIPEKGLEPKTNKTVTMVLTEKSSQIIIKGDVVALKRRQLKISEKIDLLNPGSPGAKEAWDNWFKLDDELQELEEVA